MATPTLIRSADDLTADWLSNALGRAVRTFEVTPVGTGQSSSTYRITIDAGDSVILKVADPDPAVRKTGVVTGNYEREIHFYADVAHRLPQETLSHCFVAEYDTTEGYFTLLIEDAAPARAGDQVACCTVEEARLVVRELARLVGAVVEEPDLTWLDTPWPVNRTLLGMMLPSYFQRFGDRITAEQRAVITTFAAGFDTWAEDRTEPRSIVHNDFRLDNMLFGEPGTQRELAIVDWATLKWGSITSDLAFFIGGNLSLADRRAHEQGLVRAFHDELVANGLADFTFEDCWRGYRWMSFYGVMLSVCAPLVVTQTERGDQLFLTMVERHSQHVIDLGALDLLGDEHSKNLQVKPEDEGRHDTTGERYWNESLYLDAIDESGKVGAYVRVGLVPNLGHTVYTAYIVGEGRPPVALIDYEAPLPVSGFDVTNDKFTANLVIEEPLHRVRATFAGTGESYDDPSAPLRGESGDPVAVEMDLVWETTGLPYMYQLTTRFEMPCRVTGTVRVGDELLTIDGPGQRDHSWGDRNWWSMDWTWASAHLDDDTRMQTVELRVPGLPVAAVGYEQHDGSLTEISATDTAYEIGGNRLPGRTQMTLDPTGSRYEWEPITFAPLRIASPDGRVCEFPRAMARVTTPDGRTGLGWLEWGHNVDEAGRSSPLRVVRAVAESSIERALSLVPDSAYDKVMTSPAGRLVVAAVFKALPRLIDPRRADVADAVARFKVNVGAGGHVETYDLILSLDGPPRVEKRKPRDETAEPRVTFSLDGTDLILLGAGKLDSVAAALQRRIVIEGDLQFVAVVSQLLAGDKFPRQRELLR
ncbi:DUF7064 domain-containing protein [Antrihabitans cavernicola]|nr:phosphotransferase [Spelaeibacter cavernicola]